MTRTPKRSPTTARYAAAHIARSMEAIGLADRWAFRLCDREDACWGMSSSQLDDLYAGCDALLNIVGAVDAARGRPPGHARDASTSRPIPSSPS